MPEPIYWRTRILACKIESTYGTDAEPAGADAILGTDVRLSPMQGTDVDRNLDTPVLGATGTLVADLHRQLTFKVELQGAGAAGTAPAWGKLLRACACAETVVADTSVTYNPVSDSHEAATFYFFVGDTLYKLTGARGNCTIEITASGIPYLNFTFTGLYSAAAEDTRPTPDTSAFKKPRVASNANTPTFTVNSVSLVMRSFALDLGNQVETRFLIGDERIPIVDKKEMIRTTVEAVPLTTLNPYALAEAATEVAVSLVHGTQAGSIATLSAPTCEVMRPEGLEQQQNVVEWPLRLTPLPSSGNDQWTLTLT